MRAALRVMHLFIWFSNHLLWLIYLDNFFKRFTSPPMQHTAAIETKSPDAFIGLLPDIFSVFFLGMVPKSAC